MQHLRQPRGFASYPFERRQYPAHLPPLTAGNERQHHSVVIVGGGIVGLASALALASHGVRSVVLEADDGVCIGSRAICISRRSLEILGRHGASEKFLAKGLPWTGGRSFYRDAEVLRFAMPHDANQKVPPMLNIQQYYVEKFLLEYAQQSGLAEVRWQSRVSGMCEHSDGVSVQVETPLGRYALTSDWVIGCDGARSYVREAAGLKLEGTSYEGRYVIVDIALNSSRGTERLAWFDPPSNPGATILMHRQPEDVWRIDYQLRDDEDPEEAVRPESVIPRVEKHLRWIGEADDWAPIWISLYRANALTLPAYRKRRLLLAGDAAHLVPIFGVRGANSGFEDADNLAWKLSLVINGAADESLLDSYSAERVHAARNNLRAAMKSTEFMSPPSFGFDLMRRAALGLAEQHAFLRPLINPRQTQATCYTDSGLNAPAAAGDEPTDGPVPGAVVLECPLTLSDGDGERRAHLTDLLSHCFTALYFNDQAVVPPWLDDLADSLEAGRVPFQTVVLTGQAVGQLPRIGAGDPTGQLFRLYGARPGTLYLVRPDGHVMGRWQQPSSQALGTAVERVRHPPEGKNR